MRFLADQDMYQITIDFLIDLGHEVIRVKDVGLAQALDEEILQYAHKKGLVIVTMDKDFGALVFLKHIKNSGVVLLRCKPIIIKNVHYEFEKFLNIHKDISLLNCFVVIEPTRHRIRRAG
ncbi:MAG: hypothetical protein SCARUB_00746 [Candidatus Scalindua rubra]|uniref:DUF5615 domain-containing protein n=1 Tax=Candidatus Scalindua rubra TaxID=1872076 RepID=A0A1E3XEL8_9BACT|nr:MAG: hypothetical protein SCARUB_00746 [Candidatus Scalindua rubra]